MQRKSIALLTLLMTAVASPALATAPSGLQPSTVVNKIANLSDRLSSVWATQPNKDITVLDNTTVNAVDVDVALCVNPGSAPADAFASFDPSVKPHIEPGNCWSAFVSIPPKAYFTVEGTGNVAANGTLSFTRH